MVKDWLARYGLQKREFLKEGRLTDTNDFSEEGQRGWTCSDLWGQLCCWELREIACSVGCVLADKVLWS